MNHGCSGLAYPTTLESFVTAQLDFWKAIIVVIVLPYPARHRQDEMEREPGSNRDSRPWSCPGSPWGAATLHFMLLLIRSGRAGQLSMLCSGSASLHLADTSGNASTIVRE